MRMGRIVRRMTEAADVVVYYVSCPYCGEIIYGVTADDIATKLAEHMNKYHSSLNPEEG